MTETQMIFIGMVFVAVFLLAQGLIIPVFGEGRQASKRLKKRLNIIEESSGSISIASLLREKYLKELSPLERTLESLPGMARLANIIEQSGHTSPAYRVVLISILLFAGGGILGWLFTRSPVVAVAAACIGGVIPYLKIIIDKSKRMQRFEEQFPEAIDVIKRALKAGHPFSEAIHLVSEEMDDPVAKEFAITFADINYGNDARRAMLGLLERMPSVTVMAFVTSVLVQRETGGNLAEILDRIAAVIRGRFKLHRKIRSLSAEGRMSAWILALIPFGLFLAISITTPGYVDMLTEDPMGVNLIIIASIMMIVGIMWMRKIIRIQV